MTLSLLPIETVRLRLRNWQESDRDLFFELNSDPCVMEFFPFRRDQNQADTLMVRLQSDIANDGFGFAAIELKEPREPIGFCGLVQNDVPKVFGADILEIGWRLTPRFWGKGYASEAARAWLAAGFSRLKQAEIVSYAVETNHSSLRVMQRIGMNATPECNFLHDKVPDTHPHLKPHAVYKITKAAWEKSNGR